MPWPEAPLLHCSVGRCAGGAEIVSHALTGAALPLCIIAFPLLQMAFFGTTDYRRPAEAIVVFGAQVHEGGRPSTSLVERAQTAVDLFRQGYSSTLVASGLRGSRSHLYHLARIKLAYASEGIDVYTVPTERTRWLVQLPYIMAREIPAFWVYYLRGAGI